MAKLVFSFSNCTKNYSSDSGSNPKFFLWRNKWISWNRGRSCSSRCQHSVIRSRTYHMEKSVFCYIKIFKCSASLDCKIDNSTSKSVISNRNSDKDKISAAAFNLFFFFLNKKTTNWKLSQRFSLNRNSNGLECLKASLIPRSGAPKIKDYLISFVCLIRSHSAIHTIYFCILWPLMNTKKYWKFNF